MSAAAGVVIEMAEACITEFLVERQCLEGQGLEINTNAVAPAGDLFGMEHESPSEACATDFCGDDEGRDVKPFVGYLAEEAPCDFPFRVDKLEGDGVVARGWADVEIELLEVDGDGGDIVLGRLFLLDDSVDQLGAPVGIIVGQ